MHAVVSKKPPVLSERTLMPLSFVITIVGVVVWLVTLAAKLDSQAATLDRMRERNRERDATSMEIMKRLERIDTKVDYLYESARANRRRY